MKQFTAIFCLLVLICGPGFGQRNKNANESITDVATSSNDSYTNQEKIYKMAMGYNDLEVATKALYEMIVLQPENVFLHDSLAILYFSRGYYLECALVSKEIIEVNPENNTILEILALSEDALGLTKEALAHYEKLFQNTGQLFYQYQVVSLQYKLKRYGECSLVVEELLANPNTEKETISISYQKGQSQQVSMKAAILNLKGVIALELANKALAKKCFEEAVALAPEFLLPANNLALLESENKQE